MVQGQTVLGGKDQVTLGTWPTVLSPQCLALRRCLVHGREVKLVTPGAS